MVIVYPLVYSIGYNVTLHVHVHVHVHVHAAAHAALHMIHVVEVRKYIALRNEEVSCISGSTSGSTSGSNAFYKVHVHVHVHHVYVVGLDVHHEHFRTSFRTRRATRVLHVQYMNVHDL